MQTCTQAQRGVRLQLWHSGGACQLPHHVAGHKGRKLRVWIAAGNRARHPNTDAKSQACCGCPRFCIRAIFDHACVKHASGDSATQNRPPDQKRPKPQFLNMCRNTHKVYSRGSQELIFGRGLWQIRRMKFDQHGRRLKESYTHKVLGGGIAPTTDLRSRHPEISDSHLGIALDAIPRDKHGEFHTILRRMEADCD